MEDYKYTGKTFDVYTHQGRNHTYNMIRPRESKIKSLEAVSFNEELENYFKGEEIFKKVAEFEFGGIVYAGLDFSNVTFIDSIGMSSLLKFKQAIEEYNLSREIGSIDNTRYNLNIVDCPKKTYDLFELMHIEHIFRFTTKKRL